MESGVVPRSGQSELYITRTRSYRIDIERNRSDPDTDQPDGSAPAAYPTGPDRSARKPAVTSRSRFEKQLRNRQGFHKDPRKLLCARLLQPVAILHARKAARNVAISRLPIGNSSLSRKPSISPGRPVAATGRNIIGVAIFAKIGK